MLHLSLFYVTDIGSVMAIWQITEYIIGTVPQLRTNCVQFLYKSIYLTFSLALFMFLQDEGKFVWVQVICGYTIFRLVVV